MPIEITGDGPLVVALRLLEIIARQEKRKSLLDGSAGLTQDWILDTYRKCLHATRDIPERGPDSGV
jgi:hypothetical protein